MFEHEQVKQDSGEIYQEVMNTMTVAFRDTQFLDYPDAIPEIQTPTDRIFVNVRIQKKIGFDALKKCDFTAAEFRYESIGSDSGLSMYSYLAVDWNDAAKTNIIIDFNEMSVGTYPTALDGTIGKFEKFHNDELASQMREVTKALTIVTSHAL